MAELHRCGAFKTEWCDKGEDPMALEAENIESRPLWKPLHLQPVFLNVLTTEIIFVWSYLKKAFAYQVDQIWRAKTSKELWT
jgi:hypothetical protein